MTSSLFEMKLTVREFIDIDNDTSNFENVSDETILVTVSNYIPINLTMMLLLMTHDWRWRGSSSDAKTLIPSVIRYFESRNSTTEDGLVKPFQFKCKIEQESGVIIPINWLIGKIIF